MCRESFLKTDSDFPDACVHQLFECEAARSPDALAVVCSEERLSYRRLNERANQVAHYLRELGLKPGDLVGVAMRRSPLMVIALLGIWKAGCAYVPLDPGYPSPRLAFMVRDAGLHLLLTDEQSRHSFDAFNLRMLSLDSEDSLFSRQSAANLDAVGTPADLAYVMYTSGSTGQPNGAMITHAGLANYLCWAVEAYGVGAGGSVPVHSSLSFDLTVTSLYVPLLSGAHIELLGEEGGVQALLAALRARKRSLVKITPAHLDLLNQELRPEEMAGIADIVVIGGENLAAERLSPWREHAPATRLINEYGPTETVVGCCIHEVTADDPWTGPVPIGRPIANTRLHVLDDALQQVAAGEAGELYIGGRGVAQGYLNRPQLTQERFVPDPFADESGARLYRSGDMARYRKDGAGVLECLGRRDDQVKIRGYRVELGEIEQALFDHPGVRTCAVLAYEDSTGSKELALFAVGRHGASLHGDELSAYVRQRLPSYMLPGRVIVLDAMPLNLNGKVDRSALQAVAAAAQHSTGATPASLLVAPRTPTEEMVMKAFRDALQRFDIGIFDSFFDIGGYSMLAVRIMAALREVTGINLPLRNLYEHPTVAGLADTIEALRWSIDAPDMSGPQSGEETEGRSPITL